MRQLLDQDGAPRFYKHYPRLFRAYFPEVDSKSVQSLSDAGYLYYQSILLTDSLIDDQDVSKVQAINHYQEEAIKMLSALFGRHSNFWRYWERRKKEFYTAVVLEKSLHYDQAVPFTTYSELAEKKSAFGKVAIDGLFLLDGEREDTVYKALLQSHHHFSVGFQLYDDISDFHEDQRKGQFNWAIHTLGKRLDFGEFDHDFSVLGKLLYLRGTGQDLMKQSLAHFQKALDITLSLGRKTEWWRTIQDVHQTISGYLEMTEGYLKALRKRLTLSQQQTPTVPFPNFQAIQDPNFEAGLHFIADDYQRQYAELQHIMHLGTAEGFENETDIHVSDTFQRALLNDCLLDICRHFCIVATDFFAHECQYLLKRRNKDTIGGWSYFPTVKEIAADIDDLGQITQLFVKTGQMDHAEAQCRHPIALALRERQRPNGAVETWILPKIPQNRLQQRQAYCNRTKWGTGPDVEVVANFFHALQVFDPKTYQSHCEKVVPYILQEQTDQGFWTSRWYYGPFYGSYVCLRFLKADGRPHHLAFFKAREYLLNAQNTDGGFALRKGNTSDPLSTALAILCLTLCDSESTVELRKATEFLHRTQADDGGWLAVDFIKPKASQPYKSRVLTTGWVLKALSSLPKS